MWKWCNLFLLVCILGSIYLNGQVNQRIPTNRGGSGGFPGSGSGSSSFGSTPQSDVVEEPDTIGIFYFFADNPNEETPFSDTLLHSSFQQYDPVRQQEYDYAHLGNLGSAHRPLVYQPGLRMGFDVGLHQFDLYYTDAFDLPFYQLGQAYTNLYYSQGASQSNARVGATFSRNFANGLNFSLDYKRISEVGSNTQYPNQNTRNTSLAMGMWINSPNERYDGFFSFASNTIEQEDNGGLISEPAEGEEFSTQTSAAVFLNSAQSRYAHREFGYTHYYKFGGKKDTLGQEKRAFTLAHQISLKNSNYKFFDANPAEDSSYYQQFQVDIRGVRNFINHRQIKNSFRVSTFKLDKGKEGTSQKDVLELGLTHINHRLEQEPQDSALNNLFATARWGFKLGETLRLNAYGHLGLWDNAGDYRLSGNLVIDLKKVGKLDVKAISQLSAPTLMEHRFFVSQRKVCDNDYKKTLLSSLQATYELSQVKLKLTGGIHLLTNYIYFDTLGFSRQSESSVSVFQLIGQKEFQIKNFGLNNTIALQQTSSSVLRLPDLYGKHSLYYYGKWFKVLDVRLGVDLRYTSAYKAPYYFPLTGQFQLQEDTDIPFYPAADAYFSMRVTRFRAFFKWENLTSLVITDQLFYQTPSYAFPLVSSSVRFGIRWILKN